MRGWNKRECDSACKLIPSTHPSQVRCGDRTVSKARERSLWSFKACQAHLWKIKEKGRHSCDSFLQWIVGEIRSTRKPRKLSVWVHKGLSQKQGGNAEFQWKSSQGSSLYKPVPAGREPRSLISGPGFHSDESHEGDEGGCESFCTLREHQMIASCDQVLV